MCIHNGTWSVGGSSTYPSNDRDDLIFVAPVPVDLLLTVRMFGATQQATPDNATISIEVNGALLPDSQMGKYANADYSRTLVLDAVRSIRIVGKAPTPGTSIWFVGGDYQVSLR